jgi:hypothetical protein
MINRARPQDQRESHSLHVPSTHSDVTSPAWTIRGRPLARMADLRHPSRMAARPGHDRAGLGAGLLVPLRLGRGLRFAPRRRGTAQPKGPSAPARRVTTPPNRDTSPDGVQDRVDLAPRAPVGAGGLPCQPVVTQTIPLPAPASRTPPRPRTIAGAAPMRIPHNPRTRVSAACAVQEKPSRSRDPDT